MLPGGAGNDWRLGSDGKEIVCGRDGADLGLGNDGGDTLNGGTGLVTSTGNGGNDAFVFTAVNQSRNVLTTADRTTDFVHSTNRIALSAIDTNCTGTTANDRLNFIGQQPSAVSQFS